MFTFSVDWKRAKLILYVLIISDVWYKKTIQKELIYIYDTGEVRLKIPVSNWLKITKPLTLAI